MGISILDAFWIVLILFFLYSVLSPALSRRRVNAARLRLIRRIERLRGTRVITLIHRQEAISLLGVPIRRFIDIDDSEEVLRAIRLTPPEMPIDLVVHTPGGMSLAAEQISQALVRHRGKITVLVPHYAMSGGTLIALAADEILMDANAVLGPIDPQIGGLPAISILKVIEAKPISEIDDRTIVMADIARKALAQLRSSVVTLLKDNDVPGETAEKIVDALLSGRWTHDYPISLEEAVALGLPVREGLPREIYDLMRLYPQFLQRRPSVEYVPLPYFRDREPVRARGEREDVPHRTNQH